MSFSAIVPTGGYTGWTFLKRTMDRQMVLQQAQPQAKRDEAYFREKIAQVRSAEDLVSDRRLLRIALGAFGLEGDLDSSFFIRKVLEEGTARTASLANKLSNRSYREMAAAFGFGDGALGNTKSAGFADRILKAFRDRQFEVAVGEQSNALRLALNAERELASLAARPSSIDTKWYTVMGSPPLRAVFETAFGLPGSFASIDLDQQLSVLKDRSARFLGSNDLSVLTDPAVMERLLRRFLVLSGEDRAPGNGSAALQILQNARGGGTSRLLNLLV